MKEFGVIENIEFGQESERTANDGTTYKGVTATLFFKVGDDTHICPVFLAVREGQTVGEIMRRKNYFIGARGEMTIQFGVRHWNNRCYPDVKILNWVCDNAQKPATEQVQAAPPAQANYPQGTVTVQEQVAVAVAQAPVQANVPF